MSWLGAPQFLLFRGIGGPEIAIVVVVLLLLFGATRLPKVGTSLGQSLRAFKNALTGKDEEEDEEGRVNSTVKKDEKS